MRTVTSSIGIGLAGVLAIELADFWLSPAVAGEDSVISARFPPDSKAFGALAGTGSDRSGTAYDDYVLTPSGSIVQAEPEDVMRSRPAGTPQSDIPFGSDVVGSSRPDRAKRSKQIDNDLTIHAVECGPSPLTMGDIHGLVIDAARRYGVDQDLAVAVAAVESDFDRIRNSPTGARGPMQLMPVTAARFGVIDPCEPAANIDGGVRYLALLLAEFKNPMLAIAAYNAGEDRIYEYGGIPPFPETVSYVAKVMNHQLGVTIHRWGKARRPQRTAADGTSERGVVTAKKHRRWVAGVMQF